MTGGTPRVRWTRVIIFLSGVALLIFWPRILAFFRALDIPDPVPALFPFAGEHAEIRPLLVLAALLVGVVFMVKEFLGKGGDAT